MPSRPWLLLPIALALAIGCPTVDDDTAVDDDAGDDDDDDDTGGDDDAEGCGFLDTPSASIGVSQRQIDTSLWISVYATIYGDAMPPSHEFVTEEAGCRYYRYVPGFCDPPCEWDEICTPEGACEPFPAGVSGGPLTISGLGDPLVIEDDGYGEGVYIENVELPQDQFGELDPLGASLAGDVFPAVQLQARGVATMVADVPDDELWMPFGQDTEVTWQPGADAGACVRLDLYTANEGHGLPIQDVLTCIGSDSGSITVPESVGDAFPGWMTPEACAGIDCPPGYLTRFTRDSADTAAGRAELVVSSVDSFNLIHLGR